MRLATLRNRIRSSRKFLSTHHSDAVTFDANSNFPGSRPTIIPSASVSISIIDALGSSAGPSHIFSQSTIQRCCGSGTCQDHDQHIFLNHFERDVPECGATHSHGWIADRFFEDQAPVSAVVICSPVGRAVVAVLTYTGFDSISTLSEDVENPCCNVLLATVLLCVITGILGRIEVYAGQLLWPDCRTFRIQISNQPRRLSDAP